MYIVDQERFRDTFDMFNFSCAFSLFFIRPLSYILNKHVMKCYALTIAFSKHSTVWSYNVLEMALDAYI